MSTISSPLSDPGSETFDDEYDSKAPHAEDEEEAPPAKRRRVEGSSRDHTSIMQPPEDDYGDISSDTSGSIPASPSGINKFDDDDWVSQVTVCEWEACPAGDLVNMDNLVEHINSSHIEGRTKNYICEWSSCARKNMPHASGYALRAHMRSHTREKPFYCLLPECDRCFTRSDALAKHMRMVHETEAPRPSDPVPRTMQPGMNKSQSRLKLVIKQPGISGSSASSPVPSPVTGSIAAQYPLNADGFTDLPSDMFTDNELAQGPQRLHHLLQLQIGWAEDALQETNRDVEKLEAMHRREWLDKEILLDQYIKGEIDYKARRQAVLAAQPPLQPFSTTQASQPVSGQHLGEPEANGDAMDTDHGIESRLTMREVDDAALTLANMASAS